MNTATLSKSFSKNSPLVLASKQVCGEKRIPVCFAFHLPPNNAADSGWVFWSGKEDQAYIDDNTNTIICPLRSFIDLDASLLDVLSNPVFTAWERDHIKDEWREVKDYFSAN